jgi:hypothetical protein
MRENREVSEAVIRVVLADDHPIVVAGLRALLGSLAGARWWPRRRTANPSYAKSC